MVIPAHNEAGAIARVIEATFAGVPDLHEVLVIDDGSTDDTAALAREAGARVVRLVPNHGKGVALRRGIDEAGTELLVFIDGDGQDDPREIPRLLDALGDDVAMVIGSRFLGTFERGSITRLNRLGTVAITAAMNAMFGTRITDPVAGFRAVRRSAIQRCSIAASGYDIEVDVLLALLGRGETVVEVPVARYRRDAGQTGLSAAVDGSRILGRILRHRFAATRATP